MLWNWFLLALAVGLSGGDELDDSEDSDEFSTALDKPDNGKYRNEFNDRIIGGTPAEPGEFPYQVSMQKYLWFRGYQHCCGGSIVSPKWVVTAAHCVTSFNVRSLIVVAGILRLGDSRGQVSKISKAIVHPKFSSKIYVNDIALLKMDRPFKFTPYVQPISIRPPNEPLATGTYCSVSGWGTTQEGGGASPVLRKANVPTISDVDCKRVYRKFRLNPESSVCAGYSEGGRDACQGDSGGPLACDGQLSGVVSWGIGCARKGYYGVYSEVSYFWDFLLEYVKDDLYSLRWE